MKAVVINLKRRPDRLQRFLEWNGDRGIDFEIVEAIDGSTLNKEALETAGLIQSRDLGWTMGAIGNALSHVQLWRRCAAERRSFAVFEDDALTHPQIGRILGDRKWENADLYYLGYNLDGGLSLHRSDLGWIDLAFAHVPWAERRDRFTGSRGPWTIAQIRLAWGTLGYVVNPAGAQRLLDQSLPLSTQRQVASFKGHFPPLAMDGVLNMLIQNSLLRALGFFPPLVVGPNDRTDTDVWQTRQRENR